ncbi:MFS transporter [Hylemonella sp. W303a]|uniref:MFS transporter n=1 Tax=Hylemonella sp. W303a TaxID=3389873 RepID=UPI00396B364E
MPTRSAPPQNPPASGAPLSSASPQPPTPPSTGRFIGWLSLAQLISWGSVFYLFGLLLEPVELELGLTRAQTSLGFSLALLAEGLLAWPVGRWIDRGHERAVMVGGSLLLALGLLLHSQIDGLAAFYAVWLLLGVGLAGALYPPVFAVIIRRYPQDFRRAIIIVTFLGGLASTVFIPLSAGLIHVLGWRHALWPLAALHLLVCVPIHWHVLRNAARPEPSHAQAQSTKARTTAGKDFEKKEVTASQASTPPPTLRQHLLSAPYLLVGLFIVLFMGVSSAIPPHLVSLLRGYGLPETWAILAPALIGVVQVAGRALLFFFEARWSLHTVNRLIPGLVPLALLTLLLAPLLAAPFAGHALSVQIGLVLLFVAIYGLGNGMLTIVKGTAVAEYVDRQHAASLNGALGLPQALSRAAMPWLLGVMWTPAAAYRNGLWLMLGLCVVGLVALVWAQHHASRQANELHKPA